MQFKTFFIEILIILSILDILSSICVGLFSGSSRVQSLPTAPGQIFTDETGISVRRTGLGILAGTGSTRNRNQIAMIWPEPDCNPEKVAGL